MSKQQELKLIVNGVSEEGDIVFAGVLGKPHQPTLRIQAEHFAEVYGSDVTKGDGFTAVADFANAEAQSLVYIPLLNGKPMREVVDGKRHVLKFKELPDAEQAIEGIGGDIKIIESYEYISVPADDLQLVEGLREGEAVRQTVKVGSKAAALFS